MARAQILIVEDESITAKDIEARLERLGYEVPAIVHSGEEALEKALELHPDLVLMDIRLRGSLDGIEAAEQMRARCDVPVAYLTAYADDATLSRAMRTGPFGYIVKPFEERELHSTIETALERHRLEKEVTEGRRWLETILRAAGDAIIATDRDGLVRFMNPSAEAVTGWSRAQASGKELTQVLQLSWPAGRATFEPRAARPGTTPTNRALLVARDGREVPIEETAAIARDDAGGITGFVWAFREIGDRVREEERLAELLRAARDEAAISTALVRVGREMILGLDTPDSLERLCRISVEVMECDCSHTWLWQEESRAFVPVACYGHSPEEWEVLRALRLPRDEEGGVLARLERGEVLRVDLAAFLGLPVVAAAVQFGLTDCMDIPLRRGQSLVGLQTCCYRGRRRPFDAVQHRIAEGIAQIAALSLEHARLVGELANANRLKSEFVSAVSHELRTPLTGILGYADLLLEGEFGRLTGEQQEILRKIGNCARLLTEMIEDTLDVDRLQARATPPQLTEIDLLGFLRELENDLRAQWQKPGVEVVWKADPKLPHLCTDPVKLRVVLKNVIENAIKFTQSGTVGIDVRRCKDGVEFRVTDTGIGIPPHAHEIIFEPFRQADAALTRQYGGIGLGLYIARAVLLLLGGTIGVVSDIGRGSTFRIWLPQAPGPAS